MRTSLLALAALAFSACNRAPEPSGASAPAESAAHPVTSAPSMAAPSPAPAGSPASAARELVWTDPAGWQKTASPSAMRKATYKVPPAPKDTEEGEMAVFYFRGEGGSTEANIQRWLNQFPDAKPDSVKRTRREVNGLSQTIVEVEGTYSSGMPGGPATPKSGYRMIAAVVETGSGPYFFKLTGPKKTVESARGAFMTLLDTVKSS